MPRRIKSQLGKTALLLGAGYSAKAMINPLRARGYDVIATTRMPQKAEALRKMGVTPLLYDGDITAPLKECLAKADIILSSIPPSEKGDPFLNQLPTPLLKMTKPKAWIGYLSATSVYGGAMALNGYVKAKPAP